MLELVEALVEREEPTDKEEHDRHDEAVDIAASAVAELVLGIGCLLGPLVAHEEEHLVAGIGDGVDRLREHRRRTGEGEGDELADRDADIGQQSRDHGLHATLGAHCATPAQALHRPDPAARAASTAARNSA